MSTKSKKPKHPHPHGESHTKGKKKKHRYQYPEKAINPNDALSKVIFFGRKFKADEHEAIVNANLSMSTSQITQLEFVISDPHFRHARKAIFDVGIPVKYEDLFLDVAITGTQSLGGQAGLNVKCQPRFIRQLKKRRGAKVLHNVSPSDFVRQECAAVGVRCVVQPSDRRNHVARDTKKQRGSKEVPSSWTTFKRLADELGYQVFESMNTLYFCKQHWLLKEVKDDAITVRWAGREEHDIVPTQVPLCTQSDNDEESGSLSVEFYLERKEGQKFRPGMAVKLRGVPGFNRTYLVNNVEYSLLSNDPVLIQCALPQDSKDHPGMKDGRAGNNRGTTSSLTYLLKKVGFKGDGLETAIAVCMATTGADANFIDKSDRNAKWGARVGLYSIRSLHRPHDFDGLDSKRVQKKLLEAPYNAAFVYELTKHGADWSMFHAYTSGKYKRYFKKHKDYQVKGWSEKLPQHNATGDAHEAQGTASAFVHYALQQVGDRYVFGAETSPSDPNPHAFDCSELVQWAVGRAGVTFVDGSAAQIAACKRIKVSTAIATRGALLYKPGHIAISLGDGRTVEALNPGYGVRVMSATSRSFEWTAGGVIRGLRYG